MENLNFGAGLGLLFLLIAFLLFSTKTLLAVILIHFSSRGLITKTARLLGYTNELPINSPVYFLSYVFSFLLLAPIVFGFFEIVLRQERIVWSSQEIAGSFNYFTAYLLSLTFWYYDSDFKTFQLKPLRKILLHTLVFIIVAFILNTMTFSKYRGQYAAPTFSYVLNLIIYQTIFALLTAYYLRKNKRKDP